MKTKSQKEGIRMTYQEWLDKIQPEEHREKIQNLIAAILEKYPQLKLEMKWSQPMLIDHGTYIIGFSTAAKHFSVAPEQAAMAKFSSQISDASYSKTDNLFRIKWNQEVDAKLIDAIVEDQIERKAGCKTFWAS